jgi:ParB family chromosome partitioning protein
MQTLLDAWRERLPEDDEALLPWLIALPSEQLLDLIGVCVAAIATSVPVQAMEAKPLSGYGLRVAQAAGLDMTRWWEPTADTYLASVPKAHVIALVREVLGVEAFAGLDKLAKSELVAKAEMLLKGKGWLPAVLRLKGEDKVLRE